MNHQKLLAGILALALALLALVGCGVPTATLVPPTATQPPTPIPSPMPPTPTATPVQTAEFPVGLFDCVECQGETMRFSADGTVKIYLRRIEYITGKWYVESGIFHTGDSYCRDADTMPASYNWSFDGEILTFHAIKEECADRKISLDGKPWRLIEKE